MRKTPGEGVFAPAERFPLCLFCRFAFAALFSTKTLAFSHRLCYSFAIPFFKFPAIGFYMFFHEKECGTVQKL